jgi:ATP-dependent Zn protease
MKVLKQFSMEPLLIMVVFSITSKANSSSNNYDSPKSKTSSEQHEISAIIVTNGSCKISCYWKSEQNEMVSFKRFNFSFGANDSLLVTDGKNTYNGTWSIFEANSNNERISNLKFNITFAYPIHFVGIIDGWENIEETFSYLELRDQSRRNGMTDFLTFSKN